MLKSVRGWLLKICPIKGPHTLGEMVCYTGVPYFKLKDSHYPVIMVCYAERIHTRWKMIRCTTFFWENGNPGYPILPEYGDPGLICSGQYGAGSPFSWKVGVSILGVSIFTWHRFVALYCTRWTIMATATAFWNWQLIAVCELPEISGACVDTKPIGT